MDNMPDFTMLSLSEIDMPEMPKLPQFLEIAIEDTGYNNILDSSNMEELFINLYLNENPNITFDELQQKLIEFYFQEVDEDIVSRHVRSIYETVSVSIWFHIFEKVNLVYYENNNDFNLNMIIEFISSVYGNNYLEDIYNMNCVA